MKNYIYFFLLIGSAAFGCQIQSVQTQNLAIDNSKQKEVSKTAQETEIILDKSKEISIEESFVNKDSLQIGEYVIKKVKVKKTDRETPETAKIFDAVLTKNGKQITKFEGVFYPLGNTIDFGLFSFFGNANKQLIIADTSNRYERNWIVDFSPEYTILFDTAEYGTENLRRIDFDDDGIYEIASGKTYDIFSFSSAYRPSVNVIFQFNSQIGKFLPASHRFSEFTLRDIDDQLKRFNESDKKHFHDVLEITLTYVLAGQEEKAWEFFDKNFTPENWSSGKVENKAEAKEKIQASLNDDPIYKFIKQNSNKTN